MTEPTSRYIVLRENDCTIAIEADMVRITPSGALVLYNEGQVVAGFNAGEWKGFKAEGVVVDVNADVN